jgi:hypothetical protein
MGEIFAKLKKNAVLTTKQNIFYVIKSWLPVKHGTGNPGMERGMEWNGMGNGITRNCKSRNL